MFYGFERFIGLHLMAVSFACSVARAMVVLSVLCMFDKLETQQTPSVLSHTVSCLFLLAGIHYHAIKYIYMTEESGEPH